MPDKPLPLEAAMRGRIAADLPAAFETALKSYHAFYDQTPTDDAKSFNAHHTACKAAIAHLQLLIKLAAWVENDADGDEATERLFESRKAAQDELDRFGEGGEE